MAKEVQAMETLDRPLRIRELTARLGLGEEEVEPWGWYRGKLALGLNQRLSGRPQGLYIGVSAVSPTPLGEGKTVTAIGLAMGLEREGKRTVVTLRQPSQGPVFGIKGGGAGGGRAILYPTEEINLHFTGDLHAVAAANNLLAALIDNHIKRSKSPLLDPASVTWKRVLDLNDRGLSQIISGLGNYPQAPLRETGFELTAASEVMAILALANSLEDLRARLGRIMVGLTSAGDPVFAEDLGAAGAMAALLRDAIRPNLVQTCEQTPALVHAGPFGNIAHGNSSVLADLAALRLGNVVVTESGFGADCGAEKMVHIKCRSSGLTPALEVLVCTVRALKVHSGRFNVRPGKPLPSELLREDLDALEQGAVNLQAHLDILQELGLPAVVAINRFPDDTDRELRRLEEIARESGARNVSVSEAFTQGGEGCRNLARAVLKAAEEPGKPRFLYPLEMPAEEKIAQVAKRLYGAGEVTFEPPARRQLALYQRLGFGTLPVCIAKTQYSLSHDPKLLGRPRGFAFPIRDVRLAAGAGFLYALAGDIMTMPGLPHNPAAESIDVKAGRIVGLR